MKNACWILTAITIVIWGIYAEMREVQQATQVAVAVAVAR